MMCIICTDDQLLRVKEHGNSVHYIILPIVRKFAAYLKLIDKLSLLKTIFYILMK